MILTRVNLEFWFKNIFACINIMCVVKVLFPLATAITC